MKTQRSSFSIHTVRQILLTIILALLISLPEIGHSKNVIDYAGNSYRDGDNPDRSCATYIQPGPRGVDMVWDADRSYILRQYPSQVSVNSGNVTLATPDAIYYYKENKDSLVMTGYENRKSEVTYYHPRIIRTSDMQYGDSVSGYYSGRGIYCGKLHFHIMGFQSSVADAAGIIIADGDTIRDVLRVHCHREEILRQTADSTSGNLMCADSIPYILATNGPEIIEDSWQWYAAGYRYPVMESVAVRGKNGLTSQENSEFTYLFLPYTQTMTLAYDEENTNRRQNIRNQSETIYPDETEPADFPVEAVMSLSNDGLDLSISYHQKFKGEVIFTACDVNGMLLGHISKNGDVGDCDIRMELMRKPISNYIIMYIKANGVSKSLKVYREAN